MIQYFADSVEVDQGGKLTVSKLWAREKIRLRNKYDRKFVTNPTRPVPMDPGGCSGNQVHTKPDTGCRCPISKNYLGGGNTKNHDTADMREIR